MASNALTTYDAAIDSIPNGTALTAQRKTMFKTAAEMLYVGATRENMRHLREHLQAAVKDGGNAQLAALLDNVVARLLATDDAVMISFARAIDPNA